MDTRGTAGFAPLVFLLAVLLFPAGAGAGVAAAQPGADRPLPGCGICFPGGYDLNTFGSVRGKVVELQFPDDGPVRIVLAGDGEQWVALASPVWYWQRLGLRLVPGETVTVRGSKTLGADGALYIVAQEIVASGEGAASVVRDRSGRPLWRGGRRGAAQ